MNISLFIIESHLLVHKRNEPIPVLKAALRLMRVIFTAATDISEFYRQVCIPNVVKFTTAILTLADSSGDHELKVGV